MNDVINRKDAIGAILSIEHIAELSDGDAVIRVSAVNYVLRNLPSADVQSVTPMHWIPVNPFNGGWTARWECSACGSKVTLGYCTDVMEYDFCPYCGAKDGEENETD